MCRSYESQRSIWSVTYIVNFRFPIVIRVQPVLQATPAVRSHTVTVDKD